MALTAQQIETRRNHIGGSDAKTVLEGDAAAWQALYAEKVEGVRPVFPPARQLLMDMGQAMEPLCLREFNRKVPLAQTTPSHFIWKDDPILAFTPDALTAEDRLVVQAKFHTGDQTILELAETYKAQLIHEMICSDTKRMWLAVLFGHYGRFQHMEIKFDEALADAYLFRAMEFKRYLLFGELPEDLAESVVPALTVERKRDHVWPTGDNEVAPICQQLIENMSQATLFEVALTDIKKIIKRKEYADCGSLTWRDPDGYGVTFQARCAGSRALPPGLSAAHQAQGDQEGLALSDPATLRELAQLLDRVINGDAKQRREGFVLLRFPHGKLGRPSYVATCPDEETIKMLKLLLAQLEGRLHEEGGHA